MFSKMISNVWLFWGKGQTCWNLRITSWWFNSKIVALTANIVCICKIIYREIVSICCRPDTSRRYVIREGHRVVYWRRYWNIGLPYPCVCSCLSSVTVRFTFSRRPRAAVMKIIDIWSSSGNCTTRSVVLRGIYHKYLIFKLRTSGMLRNISSFFDCLFFFRFRKFLDCLFFFRFRKV